MTWPKVSLPDMTWAHVVGVLLANEAATGDRKSGNTAREIHSQVIDFMDNDPADVEIRRQP